MGHGRNNRVTSSGDLNRLNSPGNSDYPFRLDIIPGFWNPAVECLFSTRRETPCTWQLLTEAHWKDQPYQAADWRLVSKNRDIFNERGPSGQRFQTAYSSICTSLIKWNSRCFSVGGTSSYWPYLTGGVLIDRITLSHAWTHHLPCDSSSVKRLLLI